MARSSYERLFTIVVGAGAAASSLAIAAGADVHRWGPVAALCGVGVVAEIFMAVGGRLLRRRAAHQAGASVPRGVVLRKPLWISATENLGLISFAATVAAIPAALGYPGAGVGALTILGGLPLAILGTAGTFFATSLTFEQEGLRIGTRGASLFVPWRAITGVEREGSEGHRLVCVHLSGAAEVIRAVVPDTPRSRMRAGVIIGWTNGNVGKMTMSPWTAGLDGTVLARALQEGRPSTIYN